MGNAPAGPTDSPPAESRFFPDEDPTPAVRAIDSFRDLPEYPVSRRRVGIPGPPGEQYPLPPGQSPRDQLAPAVPPPRMRRMQDSSRRQRPIPALTTSEPAMSPIAENPGPSIVIEDVTDAELMNHSDGRL